MRDMAASWSSKNTTSDSTSIQETIFLAERKKRKLGNLVNGGKKRNVAPLQYTRSEDFQQISNRNVSDYSFSDGQNNIDSLTQNKLYGAVSRSPVIVQSIVTLRPNFKSPVNNNVINNNIALDNNSTLGTEAVCTQREQPMTNIIHSQVNGLIPKHFNSLTFTINQNDQLQLVPVSEYIPLSRFPLPNNFYKFGPEINRFIPKYNTYTFMINQNNQLHFVLVSEFLPIRKSRILHTSEGRIRLLNCNKMLMCKYFFTSILTFPTESKYSATQMQKCIQELIDDRISFRAFFDRLREFLNIETLPQVIQFLIAGTPDIREALTKGEISIAGINPPPRIVIPSTVSVPLGDLPLQQNNIVTPASNIYQQVTQMVKSSRLQNISDVPLLVSNKNKNNKEEMLPNISYKDINDVIAMGGVNLAEETQIMSNSIYWGMPERSCEEIYLLNMPYLQERIKSVLATLNIIDFHHKVADVISHALEERLKNWIEDLAILSEERFVSNIAQQIMTNRDKFLVEFNTDHIGQDDIQSEEVFTSGKSSRLDENLNFDPSQASYGGLCNSRLDWYLREHIKTAELEDLVVILKRDKEHCRPSIWHLLNKVMCN